VLSEANSSQVLTVREACEIFFDFAAKYKRDYGKIPVLIIDNADYLDKVNMGILDELQDNAKLATDRQIATVVFVSSEGFLPRMRSKFI
jgi:hypothetical protein